MSDTNVESTGPLSGYRVIEKPIGYVARDFEEGKKIGIRDDINALWCIMRYGWSD